MRYLRAARFASALAVASLLVASGVVAAYRLCSPIR